MIREQIDAAGREIETRHERATSLLDEVERLIRATRETRRMVLLDSVARAEAERAIESRWLERARRVIARFDEVSLRPRRPDTEASRLQLIEDVIWLASDTRSLAHADKLWTGIEKAVLEVANCAQAWAYLDGIRTHHASVIARHYEQSSRAVSRYFREAHAADGARAVRWVLTAASPRFLVETAQVAAPAELLRQASKESDEIRDLVRRFNANLLAR